MPWCLFHYFVRAQLEAILSAGQLLPAGSVDRFGGAINYLFQWNPVIVANVLTTDFFSVAEDIRRADCEPPAVWCSFNALWERTVGRHILDCEGVKRKIQKSTLHLFPGMLARIEVDPASCPVTWEEHVAVWGQSEAIRETSRQNMRQAGVDPNQWRLSYEPIPRSRWLGVHVWDGKVWAGPPTAPRL